MISDDEGDTILTFVVGLGDQPLSLSEIISSYGAPELVYLSDCRDGRCVVQFIYLTSGMLVKSFLPSSTDYYNKRRVEVSPDTSIGKIWFFPAGEVGYRMAFPFEAQGFESALEWNGYSVYTRK